MIYKQEDMAPVQCVHCREEKEGLEKSPMPSALGDQIRSSVCQGCWKEWMTLSTKVINEHRLQLFKPEHRQILEQQMKLFLNL